MAAERRTILYAGRVQGVGFRWTAIRAMDGLALTGYVRNLPDGRVELVVEGDAETTQEAEKRVREALSRLISAENASVSPPTGEFEGLGVRW